MVKAFQFNELDKNIGVLAFDLPDSKVNTFSTAVLNELAMVVGELEKRSDLQGLLMVSGKPGQFIAGADLKEFSNLPNLTPEQSMEVAKLGHSIFDRIQNLPFPTVALIDGHCMGGGTELAISTDYRIAGPNARIGLPEVKIGLIPGWGGTQRMPRIVGLGEAMDMILSAEPMDGRKATAIGLTFDAVPTEALLEEGIRVIHMTRETGEWNQIRQAKSAPMGLSTDQLEFAIGNARQQVLAKTGGRYPAPLAVLKALEQGVNQPLSEGLAAEREASMDVMGTPIAGNMIAVFFNGVRLGGDPGVKDRSIRPEKISKGGVLGTGAMGAGIAGALARTGIPTVMVDVDENRVQAGLKAAQNVITTRMKYGKATMQDMVSLMGMLDTATTHEPFSDCDVVVEAITENEELKKQVYEQLKPHLKPGGILASNTSTISITRMAEAAPDAERFVGLHFFNPVDRMQLVEVIRGEKTSDQTVATMVGLVKKLKKTPIVVQDCAGFLVNRVLIPYMGEALVLLQEGATLDQLDKVAVQWGMPMGPMALQDMVGMDVGCSAGKVTSAAYFDRSVHTPVLDAMVAAGRLGMKTGAGFRKFDAKGRPQSDPEALKIIAGVQENPREIPDQEIEDRLFLVMALEAVRAWEERIVRQPGDVDMGMILGVGFPAFRGGPLRWIDTEGSGAIVERTEPYQQLGKRFEPPALLLELAGNGGKIHS